MNRKKICFVAQFPPPMHGLSKAVETLYYSQLNSEINSNAGFKFEKIDLSNNRKLIYNVISLMRSQADLFYFTISQTREGNIRDLIILKILSLRNKKCVIHLHGGYYRKMVDSLNKWQKRANYHAISELEGAIVLGPTLKPIFQGMLPDSKIYTIPNCVDDEYLMSKEQFDKKQSRLKHLPVYHVLYLSNFIRSKGYPEVLEMARLEKERVESGGHQMFHFDFAGKFFEEDEEKFFKEYIKTNCLDDFITYHGIVGGDRKRELLELCAFFVLLTTYPKEGQPISILEAMGNGMCIVTTNHAGIPDVVTDNINGIVTNCDEIIPDKIYSRMMALTRDITRYSCENREKVLRKYTQNQYINSIADCWIKILGDLD